MVRRGRRPGLSLGYAIGVLGATVAIVGIVDRSLPLLMIGTLFVGFGNSSNQLSRYAAADMYPDHRRASAIGTVVWAATVGAVLGPNLIGPAGIVAEWLGLPRLAGAYLVPIAFVGLASILSFVFLRPDPIELADRSETVADPEATKSTIREIVRSPGVAAALVALVASQTVMVLIMTMTPVHMTAHGHHVETVGLVISGHTFGMFALSPLSGRLTDRFGSGRVIAAGLAVLAAASILAAIAPPDGGALLFLALFLLGVRLESRVRGRKHNADPRRRCRRQDPTRGHGRLAHLEQRGGREPRVGRGAGGGKLHGAGPPRRRPHDRSTLAVHQPESRRRDRVLAAGLIQLADDPRREDPGAVGDLGKGHVLVGAVGDADVARPEDHRWR